MGSQIPIRLLVLAVVALGSSQVATTASWIVWSMDLNAGKALIAGAAAFAGSAPLIFGALKYLMRSDA
ncbi:hypothetical protein GA0070216_10118 [Micromonospora matsumotoense]|uniref:Uncharacterized protein n=1 Tax=Micromonospora matsumotoense TaxID=121616 RepID=A0A1C4TW20_9ACTN|nr:hypothetical protein [Micromonospora matsumotoense]SCE63622.1 hypothetical protein GA0070216_10118 [Micromonospora matsumotoense]